MRKLLLLLAILSALAIGAPAGAADQDNLLTGYALTSWIDADGVPLGTVYALGEDRHGYLWIGTDAGLFRFDGLRFTPWDVLSDAALPRSPVSALWVAKDDSVWVGFASGGVRRLRDGQLQPRDQPQGSLGAVTDLAEDRHGTVWAIADGGLHRVRDGRWQTITLLPNRGEANALHLHVGPAGDLWVGTSRGGAFRRIGETDDFQPMARGFTWGIADTPDGVWTTDIVAGFRRLGGVRASRPIEGSGYRLLHDHRGHLWVATLSEGLWLVRDKLAPNPHVETTSLRTGLSSDSVQSLLEDREGNVWVGTTGGLHRLTERTLTPVENVGFVVDVVPTADGNLIAGTTNGVVRFSPTPRGPWQRDRAAQPGGPDVRVLYRDPRGAIWIGTNAGVWRYASGSFTRVPLPKDAALPVTIITGAADGGVWLGDNIWLYHWDGSTLVPFDGEVIEDPKRITYARADSTGRVWLALDQARLGALDKSGAVRVFGAHDGLRNGTHTAIYTVFEDREHVVWIGGNGGLTRFDGGRFATIGRDQGLPASRVSSIVEDDEGYLWLSVERGLIRLKRDEVAQAVEHSGHRVQYRLYDTSDGLAGAPLGAIRSSRAPDGRLWFARGGGLTVVDPRALGAERAPSSAPIQIEAALANERRLMPAPQTRLPAGTRRLQISYTAVSLTASNKIRFRYRLDGFDTDWIEAGTRRQAFYTNLSPRDYQFRVEAASEDGRWTASSATWPFTISPAFYQTSWFFSACALGAVLVVWGSWRVRLRLVRRQFSMVLAERARLSREIHDTLLQSLVGVALQFDGISNSIGHSPAAARNQLVRIRREVEAYIREARQSIWDLRSPVLETLDLPSALRDFGKRAAAGTAIRFATSVTGTLRQCPAKVENQLLRIGQEAMTNAVRHAGAKRITLDLRFDERTVLLRVSDDGGGFDPDAGAPDSDNHYGLTTMRERAEELGGQLTITSAPGAGTVVEATVPL